MFVTYNPENEPVVQTHEGIPTLEVMQEAVGGLIEPVMLWDDPKGMVDMYVNEEGLYLCEPSLILDRGFGMEPIYGPVIFSRTDHGGKNVGLTLEDVKRLARMFSNDNPRFSITRLGILPVYEVVE